MLVLVLVRVLEVDRCTVSVDRVRIPCKASLIRHRVSKPKPTSPSPSTPDPLRPSHHSNHGPAIERPSHRSTATPRSTSGFENNLDCLDERGGKKRGARDYSVSSIQSRGCHGQAADPSNNNQTKLHTHTHTHTHTHAHTHARTHARTSSNGKAPGESVAWKRRVVARAAVFGRAGWRPLRRGHHCNRRRRRHRRRHRHHRRHRWRWESLQ